MEQRAREVAVRHLQTVIHPPECRCKCVADTRETTARSRVCLEHHELLAVIRCGWDRAEILRNEVLGCGVRQVVGEHVLRIYGVTKACIREGGSTIVIGVSREDRVLA